MNPFLVSHKAGKAYLLYKKTLLFKRTIPAVSSCFKLKYLLGKSLKGELHQITSHTQADRCAIQELCGEEVVSCDARVPLFPVLAVILSYLAFSLILPLTG